MKQLNHLFLLAAVIISAVVILFYSCRGSKLEGTYSHTAEKVFVYSYTTTYSFRTDGTVTQIVNGNETEMDYEVDGNKIRIKTPDKGVLVMTLRDDGTIIGPAGNRFNKLNTD